MAVTFNKFQPFVENLAEKGIKLDGTGLTLALSNTTIVNTWGLLASVSQVSYTNCSIRVCTVATSAQTSGTYKLCLTDLVLTASGGDVGPFQFVVLYDDSSTGDMLIGWYDYGGPITLHTGETLTVNFDDANGVLTLA